jgi:hypothetical protein
VNAHQRFVAHLATDALDEADRSHAAGCPECRPLLPGDGASTSPASLEAIHARSLEALRAAPVRPWWRDALLLAALNAVVAVSATALLGAARWRVSTDARLRLALVGVLLFGTLTLGGMAALAPRRRHSLLFLLLAFLLPAGLLLAGHGLLSPLSAMDALPGALNVLLIGLVPVAATLLLLRHMAYDGRRAAAVALASGATGLFALHWHCIDGTALHLIGFHALPWLSLAAVAVAIRRLLPTQNHVP